MTSSLRLAQWRGWLSVVSNDQTLQRVQFLYVHWVADFLQCENVHSVSNLSIASRVPFRMLHSKSGLNRTHILSSESAHEPGLDVLYAKGALSEFFPVFPNCSHPSAVEQVHTTSFREFGFKFALVQSTKQILLSFVPPAKPGP